MILILSYIYEAGDVSPSAVAYGGSVLPSLTGTLERSCIAGTRRKSLPRDRRQKPGRRGHTPAEPEAATGRRG